MGAIKEFYHEEICQGQEEAFIQEWIDENEADLEKKERDDEDKAIILEAFKIEEDIFNSELPRFMHQDASLGDK